MMMELYCVGDLYCACGFHHDGVAAVVLKCYTHIPTRCTAEVPIFSHPYLFVCDDVAPKRADGGCVIIKWTMEVLPCRSGGVEGCLSEQV